MRLVLIFGLLGATLSGAAIGLSDSSMARTSNTLGRATCTKLALETKALERGGVEKFLKMKPQNVVADHGRPVVERVRHYISLKEQVLFRCPLNVLNATAAPIADRAGIAPPLPVKGPRRRARVRSRSPRGGTPRLLVPLPVKRSSRS